MKQHCLCKLLIVSKFLAFRVKKFFFPRKGYQKYRLKWIQKKNFCSFEAEPRLSNCSKIQLFPLEQFSQGFQMSRFTIFLLKYVSHKRFDYCDMISTIYFHPVMRLVNLENNEYYWLRAGREIQNDK